MYKYGVPCKTKQNERNGAGRMERYKYLTILSLAFILSLLTPISILADNETELNAEESEAVEDREERAGKLDIPDHVISIAHENTFPNAAEDTEVVEPSSLTKDLLDNIDIDIENPELIKMLNETSIKPSPIGIGYRGMIFLGRWALNYESEATTANWQYQLVNSNDLNNIGGNQNQTLTYQQQDRKEVKGALTSKITNGDDVMNMLLIQAQEKTDLPLAYQTVVGQHTRKEQAYNIPPQKQGTLQAYAPAINEKGQVTFGEVYIELKGTKKNLVIKNVTKQGIGAWIPIQDHLSFSFHLK